MRHIVYIGVDDTDVIGSIGTGKVARGLASHLVELGLGTSRGVSRHQLLVDPRVRYTSHNSSKGLAIETERSVIEFYQPAADWLSHNFASGADPGLCICDEERVSAQIIIFGRKAVTEVLTKQAACDLAAKYGIFLKGIGGDEGGVIGALASVGLRAWGNEGRLVDLPGIHEITGLITVGDLLSRTPIKAVQKTDGTKLGKDEIIDSKDWIRPSLVDGEPVLKVEHVMSSPGKLVWVSIEKRMKGDD